MLRSIQRICHVLPPGCIERLDHMGTHGPVCDLLSGGGCMANHESFLKPLRRHDQRIGGINNDLTLEVPRRKECIFGTLPWYGQDHNGGPARCLGYARYLGVRPYFMHKSLHLSLGWVADSEGHIVFCLRPAPAKRTANVTSPKNSNLHCSYLLSNVDSICCLTQQLSAGAEPHQPA